LLLLNSTGDPQSETSSSPSICEGTISTGSSNSAKSSILPPKNSENATPIEPTKKSTPLNSCQENPPNNKSPKSEQSLDLKETPETADIQSKAVDTIGDKSKFSVNHSYEGSDHSFSDEMTKSKCRLNKKSKMHSKRPVGTRTELGAIGLPPSKPSLNTGSRNEFDYPNLKMQSEENQSGGDLSQYKVRGTVKRPKDLLRAGSRYDLGTSTSGPRVDGLLDEGLR
jgi:hypothetical protein